MYPLWRSLLRLRWCEGGGWQNLLQCVLESTATFCTGLPPMHCVGLRHPLASLGCFRARPPLAMKLTLLRLACLQRWPTALLLGPL